MRQNNGDQRQCRGKIAYTSDAFAQDKRNEGCAPIAEAFLATLIAHGEPHLQGAVACELGGEFVGLIQARQLAAQLQEIYHVGQREPPVMLPAKASFFC